MSKKREARRQGTRKVVPPGKRKVFAVTALLVGLLSATGILAQRAAIQTASKPATGQPQSAAVAPASLDPGSPSKEYIYAGGRLIATEEPTGQSCTYSLSPDSASFTDSGGSGSVFVTVTAGTGCNWTAVSNAGWITITAGAGGSGNGTVSYTVAANPGSARTGTMTIAGLTFTVTQAAAPGCSYTLSPASQAFPASGGTGGVSVTTAAGCSWTATSNATWITITSGSGYNGTNTVNYSVAANSGSTSRTGTLTLAGQTFTVTQSGAVDEACTLAPSNLVAGVSGTSIILTWQDNSTCEQSFDLERKVGSGSFARLRLISPNITSYTDSALPAGTYTYRIRAVFTSTYSGYSNEAAATVVGPQPPAAPTSLVATAASPSQINLTWIDNSTNEDGFKIERCAGAGCTNFTQVITVGPGVTAYQDTGLAASTTYTYRVRAYNGVGDSAYTNTAGATTSAPPPPTAPSDLVATAASQTQVNLTWIDNSANEESFKVERKTTSTAYAEIASLGAGTTTYADTTAVAGTAYTYRVRAYNSSGGYSTYSNEASATTPGPETVLLADDFNDNALDAGKWSVSVLSGTQDTTVPVAEANQRLQIGPLQQNATGSHYNGILSASAYDLTGASASVQAVSAPPANTNADLMFTAVADGSNHYRVYVSAGALKFEKKVGGTKTLLGSLTFDAVNHAFWRLRHNAATDQMVFETAPSSGGAPGTWTAQQSIARELAITALKMELKAGTWQAEANAPGTVSFDNFKLAGP